LFGDETDGGSGIEAELALTGADVVFLLSAIAMSRLEGLFPLAKYSFMLGTELDSALSTSILEAGVHVGVP